jgi:hypothetical protein
MATTRGWMDSRWVAVYHHTSRKLPTRGTSRPSTWRNWLVTTSTAAPAVKPVTTAGETKFTSAPRRARPKPSWMAPASSVSVSASVM